MFCGECQTRFKIGGMICLTSMIVFIVQGNMSIAIIAMTKPTHNFSLEIPNYGLRYEWSLYVQSLVIGSYFWGYVAIAWVAGVFTEHYGPRNIVGYSLIVATVLSAITPIAANFLWLSILIRFFTGLVMGTIFPSLQALISNWAPPEEKGKFLAAFLSNGLGNVIVWSFSGITIEKLGWDYVFYFVAVILGIFTIIWFLNVHDSPSKHPQIAEAEREYILRSLQTTTVKQKRWPPLLAMFLSIPFWALIFFHFGSVWALFFFLTATPKYLNEVHSFNIAAIGFVGSIPYLVRFAGGILFGFLGDLLLKKKIMTPNTIRKAFSMCSHIIPGLVLIGLMLVDNQPYICVGLIAIALGFNGSVVITSLQNPHDLAPNFASTVFGIVESFSATPGFLAPLVVAYFTEDGSTDKEWRYIFMTGAIIAIGTAIIFILFGSGYTQKWNEIDKPATKAKKGFRKSSIKFGST